MRAVAQRVCEAYVEVDHQRVAQIGPGLVLLIGVGKLDERNDAEWLAKKIAHLRIFSDPQGKMNRSVLEGTRDVIAVSQFTLYGDVHKGNRPSFIDAKEPAEAKALYEYFCDALRQLGVKVETGVFAADMKVGFVNDGPVTILLDSR